MTPRPFWLGLEWCVLLPIASTAPREKGRSGAGGPSGEKTRERLRMGRPEALLLDLDKERQPCMLISSLSEQRGEPPTPRFRDDATLRAGDPQMFSEFSALGGVDRSICFHSWTEAAR